ncbi:hypothetical protein EJB05_14030, partial [Eragrostis curvula]
MRPPRPRPPPLLMDELVEEVLLRFPRDSSACLVRAALVCKHWRRIVSGPSFRRRIREFHRSAPMLGILCNASKFRALTTRFVPVSSSCLPHAEHHGLQVWDSRHGRVILGRGYKCFSLVVWDPITDKRQELPKPPLPPYHQQHPHSWSTATVLCAAATGECDHLNCHHEPFIVVLVRTVGMEIFSYVHYHRTGLQRRAFWASSDGKKPVASNTSLKGGR